MTRISGTSSILTVTLLSALSIGSLVYGDSRTDQVDELFEKWDKADTPGCALGIIQEGEFVYKRGYGMANLEYGIPNASTTVFRTGSVSKQFTTMSILLAEAKSKLSLDDDIRKHLPEMPEYERTVTIGHLIHHTSGVRDYLVLMRLAGKRDEDYYTNEEVMEALSRLENLNFTPGSEYLYSNSGYWLLSQIIERATGRTLREWADEQIFEPLAMKNSHFHDDPRMIVPNRASGYRPKGDGGFEIDMTPLEMVGDGGVFTTIDDLLEWDRNFDSKMLSEDVMEKMMTPGILNNGRPQDYAGGLRVSHYRGLPVVEHGGAFVGFRAAMMRFPEQGFSAYCLCNVSEAQPTELLYKIADIYLGSLFREEDIPTVSLPEEILRRRVGTYWDDRTSQLLEIKFEQGQLQMVTGERHQPLLPLSETRFIRDRDQARADLEFHDGRDGETLRVEVRSEGQRPFEYESIKPGPPNAEELQDYTGSFYCRELDATYYVKAGEGNQLVVDFAHFPEKKLESMFPDGFRYDSGNVVFARDDEGKITGFRLSSGRARNFEFVRTESEN